MSDRRWGVLFDIDGTLVDNVYLHAVAWARAFADAGEQPPTSLVHRHIGMGSQQLIEAVLGRSRPEVSEGHSAHLTAFEADMRPFPAAADLLRAVARRGGAVVLATSAKPEEVEARVKLIGADDVVAHVTSSGDVDAAKPEPDLFLAALRGGGLEAERALAVGDSVWDVQAATRAGLACVAVETGGFSEAELREGGAVAVYRDVAALLADLDRSPLAQLAGH